MNNNLFKKISLPILIISLFLLTLPQWNPCFAGIGSWGDQGNGTYKNPLLNADYSDPDIIRVGTDFFMVASEFHFMGMPVLHSKDLVNWTIIAQIYTRMTQDPGYDSFNRYGRGSWAPSIRYYNNKYWVYFCTPDEGLYMSTATNPAGPWSALYEVKRISNWEDPCPFWDDDGQAYLGHSVLGAGPIIIHKMSADGTQLLDNGTTVYTGPTAEGTKIYKRNGYYYIWIPEGGVSGGWQTVLRATNIYGPYTSKRVLEQGSTGINGPHQGGWVELTSGESWFMHFQDRGVIGRICHLQPVVWQSDWPVVGQDYDGNGVGEPVPSWNKPNVGATYPITAPQASDEFNNSTLGLQWEWNHNPVNANWSLSARSGYLRLIAVQGSDFMHAKNTLTQKLMGRTGNAVTEVDVSNMADGQKAGLCHISNKYHWIGVEKTGGTRTIKVNLNGTVTSGPNVSGNTVWFRTNINLDGSTTLLYSQDGTNFTQLGGSCSLSNGYWKGSKIGLFNYNSGTGGGNADFNWFHYTYDGPGDGSLPTSTPAPTPAPGNMGVNCGGSAYTDGLGKLWSADQAYTTGGWGYATGGSAYSTVDAIANTTDDPLYQSERYVTSGNLEYRFTVSNGTYNVTIKYAEIYFTSSGQKDF